MPGDVSFEIPPIELKGTILEPDALGRPGMPLVNAKRAVSLVKQRQVFATTKNPVEKEAQAAVLATLLYQQSKTQTGDEQQKSLTEARQALRDAAALSGAKVDEVTLRLLGSYELMFNDYPAAEKAWGDLMVAAPKDPNIAINRAWWAFSLLKQYKTAEALAAVNAQPATATTPELAYVTAWAKFRSNDGQGAWDAIVLAEQGWGGMAGREIIDRETLIMFAGRTHVPMATAMPKLQQMFGNNPQQQYAILAKLGQQSYQFAGRWADAVAAIDQAIAVMGPKVPPDDLVYLRYQEADYLVRLDDPATAATHAKEALAAMPACGTKCSSKDIENVVEGAFIMGKLFHILYATANDYRFYDPAHDLYSATQPLLVSNNDMRAEAGKNLTILEATLKGMKHDVGTHDKAAIGALLGRHNQEAMACYEQFASGNPKLGGNVVLKLESDETGVMRGVTTEPKAGMADLAAVAGCIADFAKTWKLPKHPLKGVTRITMTYSLSAKQPAPTPNAGGKPATGAAATK